MPFRIMENDITKVEADAIVNTANPYPIYAGATDRSIYEAAGAEQLLEERKKIGVITPGNIAVTPAFRLKAKYIIHAVGPVWRGGRNNEEALLKSCLNLSLAEAEKLGCRSIAFPLISTGAYGFPKQTAIRIFIDTVYDFLMKCDMDVILVLYSREALEISSRMFGSLRDRPAEKKEKEKENLSLEEMIANTRTSFRDCLFQLMNESGMDNPQIYHAANITKQHFSKILGKKDYMPGKNTICALALGMQLEEEKAELLLNKAGYALSDSLPFDQAVRYFLRNHMYQLIEINILLYENGLEQIGTLTKLS